MKLTFEIPNPVIYVLEIYCVRFKRVAKQRKLQKAFFFLVILLKEV